MAERQTVSARRLEDIHRMAVKNFADHQIEQRLNQGAFRYWYCGKAQSSMYYFSITTVPGRLIIAGDIGLLVLEREYDMLQWARQTTEDISYFAGKVVRQIPTREYCSEVAREWCDAFAKELKQNRSDQWDKQLQQVRKLWETADDETWFKQDLYGSALVDGCDFPSLDDWNPNFLWCREALLWFLERVPAQPLEEPKRVETVPTLRQ